MKISKSVLLLVVSCLLLVSTALAIPSYLSYQGVLRDSGGTLVNATKAMKFRIYDASTSGTEKFAMTSSEVVVSGGLYNVMLGPLGFAEMAKGPRWLEVEVANEILSPRIELVAVAYAVAAASAEVAEYAYQAGSATSATNTTYVNNIPANSSATAGALYPLDSTGKISKVAISAEASVSTYALFLKGRLGAVTGDGFCAGTGVVLQNSPGVVVTNEAVTGNSIILITVGHAAAPKTQTTKALKVSDLILAPTKNFTVSTVDNINAATDIPFGYLIIN